MARFREGDPVRVLYHDRAGRVQYRAAIILWEITAGRYRVELDRGDLMVVEDRELWPGRAEQWTIRTNG